MKAFLFLATALPAVAFANTVEHHGMRDEIFINGTHRTIFECVRSSSGACHNVLFAEGGQVMHRLRVPVGTRLSLVDLPDNVTVCVSDGREDDLTRCQRVPVPVRSR